ncbi:MAG: DUF1697 domain-containing protein [Lysobacterales bacterium]
MTRYVALFRGINVGRAKRVAMADLRALLGDLGYSGATTLLNSGNAVFDAGAAQRGDHAQRIRSAVAERLGVDAAVIVKSAAEWKQVMSGNPFAAIASDPSRLLVAVTRTAEELAVARKLAAVEWGDDRIHVGAAAAYVWCAGGILASEAAMSLMKALGQTVTTRNWATAVKIDALLRTKR